jgi:hypothetical protein
LTTPNIGDATGTSLSTTGNITGSYILGNGSQLTGIDSAAISNGTSNVRVFANSNVTVSVASNANIATFATDGLSVTGLVSSTGNVQGSNLVTDGLASVTGNVSAGNLVLTTGNLTLSNVNINSSTSAIQGWSYSNVSLLATGTGNAETNPTGLFFGNAGSSFYLTGTAADRVFQYNMSTTNMANTGTVFGNVGVTTQDGSPNDLYIDGTGANL